MDKDPPTNSEDRSLVQEDSTSHGATKRVCHSYQSPCTRGPMLCNKSSHHNENSVHCNDTVASTHCNWRKTCINEDWAQPKIKINSIKKKKKNKRNVVGQVNWSDISTLAIICLYLCLSLQKKAPWGQEPFLICICNYCILLREVRYSHPSAHLPCYCLSLSRPHQPRYCFRV